MAIPMGNSDGDSGGYGDGRWRWPAWRRAGGCDSTHINAAGGRAGRPVPGPDGFILASPGHQPPEAQRNIDPPVRTDDP